MTKRLTETKESDELPITELPDWLAEIVGTDSHKTTQTTADFLSLPPLEREKAIEQLLGKPEAERYKRTIQELREELIPQIEITIQHLINEIPEEIRNRMKFLSPSEILSTVDFILVPPDLTDNPFYHHSQKKIGIPAEPDLLVVDKTLRRNTVYSITHESIHALREAQAELTDDQSLPTINHVETFANIVTVLNEAATQSLTLITYGRIFKIPVEQLIATSGYEIEVKYFTDRLTQQLMEQCGLSEDDANTILIRFMLGDEQALLDTVEGWDGLDKIASDYYYFSTKENEKKRQKSLELFREGDYIDPDGRYRVIRNLHREFKQSTYVYLVFDEKFKMQKVVKLLSEDDIHIQEAPQMVREAKTLAKFSHQNIETVHESFDIEKDNRKFHVFVKEYVNGPDYEDWIEENIDNTQQETLELKRKIIQILRSIANGVDYLSDFGTAHRDLSPGNVIVGKDKTKIVDLSLATQFGERHLMGTPFYSEAYGPIMDDGVEATYDGEIGVVALIALRSLLPPMTFKKGAYRESNLALTPEQIKAIKAVLSKALYKKLGIRFEVVTDFEATTPSFETIHQVLEFQTGYTSASALIDELEEALFLGEEDESPTKKRKRKLKSVLERYMDETNADIADVDKAEQDELKTHELQKPGTTARNSDKQKEVWKHRPETRPIRLWNQEISEERRKNDLLAKQRWLYYRWRRGEFGLVESLLTAYKANQSKTYLTEREKQDMRDFRDLIVLAIARIIKISVILTGYALARALSFIIRAGIATGVLVLPPLWKHSSRVLQRTPHLMAHLALTGTQSVIESLFVQTERDKLEIALGQHNVNTFGLSNDELRNLLKKTQEERDQLAQKVRQEGGQTESFFWGPKSSYQLKLELEKLENEERKKQEEERRKEKIQQQRKLEKVEKQRLEAEMAAREEQQRLQQQYEAEQERLEKDRRRKAEEERQRHGGEEEQQQTKWSTPHVSQHTGQKKQEERAPIAISLPTHEQKNVSAPIYSAPRMSDKQWADINEHLGEQPTPTTHDETSSDMHEEPQQLATEEMKERVGTGAPGEAKVYIPSLRPNPQSIRRARHRLGSNDPKDEEQVMREEEFRSLIEKLTPNSNHIDEAELTKIRQRLADPEDHQLDGARSRLATQNYELDEEESPAATSTDGTPRDRLSRDNWETKEENVNTAASSASSKMAMKPKQN